MSDFRKCIRYSKISGVVSQRKLFYVVFVFNCIIGLVISVVAGSSEKMIGINVSGILCLYLCMTLGVLKTYAGTAVFLRESGLRKYYICTFTPLCILLVTLVVWLVYILPFLILQRINGADFVYTSSVVLVICIINFLMVTGVSLIRMGNIIQIISGFILIFLQLPFEIFIMSFAGKCTETISNFNSSGTIIFIAALVIQAVAVLLSFGMFRVFYRKVKL